MYGYVHMYGVHKFAISSDLIDLGAKVRGFFFQQGRELIYLTKSGLPLAPKLSLLSSFVML